MFKNKKVLLIIPSRKGSVGLKNKNLTKIGNKSLVEWSIHSARKVLKLDKIFVSTNSEKIRKISLKSGVSCPFLRPSSLSSSKAKPSDVIIHVLNHLKKEKQFFDFFVYLEPTSPFTTSKDIYKSIKFFLKNYKTQDSLVSVSRFEKIHQSNILKKYKNSFKPILNKYQNNFRRQDSSDLVYLDGSIYISKVKEFYVNRGFLHPKTNFIFFDQWKSIEIDNKDDLVLAKSLYSKNKKLLKNENKVIQ